MQHREVVPSKVSRCWAQIRLPPPENHLSPMALVAGMTSNSFPRIESLPAKSFCSCSLLMHVVQIANHQYNITYYCCGCRDISSNCLHMRIRRFVHLKTFLFVHCILQVRKSIFRKSWVCIRWSRHSALKCFQASMATSRISSLVTIQPSRPAPAIIIIRLAQIKGSNFIQQLLIMLFRFSIH